MIDKGACEHVESADQNITPRHLDVKNVKKKEQNGLHYGCVSLAVM
ncbi:MAG: hypothetical protein WBZ36_06010 [Candidatus Nitrosopolaris sp.]